MDLLAVCLKRGSLQLYGVSVNDVRPVGEALLGLFQLLESDKAEAPGAHKVWSLTQFYTVDFSQSRIGVSKCVFYKRTIKVCVSCC